MNPGITLDTAMRHICSVRVATGMHNCCVFCICLILALHELLVARLDLAMADLMPLYLPAELRRSSPLAFGLRTSTSL